jgi:hypothetical protein
MLHSPLRSPLRRVLRSPLSGYDPIDDLGSSLLAWWDATRGISLSGSSVAAWTDKARGLVASQSTSAARPTFDPAGFNGFPCLTFDGTDDRLMGETMPFPTGANPVEIWMVLSQDAATDNDIERRAFAYGDTAATSRLIQRPAPSVVSTTNRARLNVGNGTTTTAITPAADFGSRHLLRAEIGATTSRLTMDGSATSSASVTPSTASARYRIGASSASAATSFWLGKIRHVIVTLPLSSGPAARLQTFLLAQRAI